VERTHPASSYRQSFDVSYQGKSGQKGCSDTLISPPQKQPLETDNNRLILLKKPVPERATFRQFENARF